jgi:hypothetical protein
LLPSPPRLGRLPLLPSFLTRVDKPTQSKNGKKPTLYFSPQSSYGTGNTLIVTRSELNSQNQAITLIWDYLSLQRSHGSKTILNKLPLSPLLRYAVRYKTLTTATKTIPTIDSKYKNGGEESEISFATPDSSFATPDSSFKLIFCRFFSHRAIMPSRRHRDVDVNVDVIIP